MYPLNEKNTNQKVHTMYPTVGTFHVPLYNTQGKTHRGEKFHNFLDQQGSESVNNLKINSSPLESNPTFDAVGDQAKRLSHSEAGGKRGRPKLAYKPLTDLEIYEIAKKFTVDPLEVKEVSKSAIHEFEAGNIIKPTSTYETTISFVAYRLSVGQIEQLPNLYLYLIEEAHPLHKTGRKLEDLSHQRKVVAEDLQQLQKTLEKINQGIEESRLPRYLVGKKKEEQIQAVTDRIYKTKLVGKTTTQKIRETHLQLQQLIAIFPDEYKRAVSTRL